MLCPFKHSYFSKYKYRALNKDTCIHTILQSISITYFLNTIIIIILNTGHGFIAKLYNNIYAIFTSQGLLGSKGIPESGGAVAMRALGLGTLYAFSGVGLFCFVTWKLLGVHSVSTFWDLDLYFSYRKLRKIVDHEILACESEFLTYIPV